MNESQKKSRNRKLVWKKVALIMLSAFMGFTLTTEGTVFPPPPRSSKVPVIVVHGMGGTPLYRKDENGNWVRAGSVAASTMMRLLDRKSVV